MPRSTTIDDLDDVEIVPLALPLDRDTVAWLLRMTNGDDAHAAEIVASIVRQVREDDEEVNRVLN